MSDKIIYLKEIDSTNVYADRLCRNGGEIPLAVVADFQTKGSGRMGRSFHSPKGTGIYMTYILDTKNVETLNLITTSAGLAVAEVLEEYCSLVSSIKWPNDILLSSGKVCGILTRLITEKGKIKLALIGIGINVSGKKEDFPEEIKDIATTLEEETETIFDKNFLTQKIIENLNEIFINKKYTEKQKFPTCINKCKSSCPSLLGSQGGRQVAAPTFSLDCHGLRPRNDNRNGASWAPPPTMTTKVLHFAFCILHS